MRDFGRRGQSGSLVSRHLDDLDAVLEIDVWTDLGQLVFAFKTGTASGITTSGSEGPLLKDGHHRLSRS
jgi:hypothetical protein